MAELRSITETPEAITVEAAAYVWQAYDAPRKRVPRARIVEHRFTVSIPKLAEEAAPLAFVIEHFPEMVWSDKAEYRAGYDQPVRYAGGKFYTPARFERVGRYGAYDSPDPVERMTAYIESAHGVSESERKKYADAISRDEIRADSWPATYDTAERVEDAASYFTNELVVIGGELWQECNEPTYEYYSSWYGRDNYRHIYVTTGKPGASNYGAHDAAALAYWHAGTTRSGYIRVIRPDLVTIDATARDLAEKADRAARKVEEARDRVREFQEMLKDARATLAESKEEAKKASETAAAYKDDPRAYWIAKADKIESGEGFLRKGRATAAAAAVRRIVEAEAI